MGKIILGWTMSLDGFINDRTGSVEALYIHLSTLPETEASSPSRTLVQW